MPVRGPSYGNRGGADAGSLVPLRLAPPLGFWFRSAWRFPRRDEYLRMLEEYHDELEEELTEVRAEIERMKSTDKPKDYAVGKPPA